MLVPQSASRVFGCYSRCRSSSALIKRHIPVIVLPFPSDSFCSSPSRFKSQLWLFTHPGRSLNVLSLCGYRSWFLSNLSSSSPLFSPLCYICFLALPPFFITRFSAIQTIASPAWISPRLNPFTHLPPPPPWLRPSCLAISWPAFLLRGLFFLAAVLVFFQAALQPGVFRNFLRGLSF